MRLSGQARSYLLKDAADFRRYSRPAADAFLARMADARRSLARFPELGFGSERSPLPNGHRLVVGDYVLDYDVEVDGVVVTSIRHGAQRPGHGAPEDDFDYEA